MNHVQESWRALVDFAHLCRQDALEAETQALAKRLKANLISLERKVLAIRFLLSNRVPKQEIVMMGQTAALAAYRKGKSKDGAPPETQKFIKWLVPVSLADAIKPGHDKAETLQERFHRVCGIRTSQDFWEFLLSCFADLTDAELKNLAGVEKRRK